MTYQEGISNLKNWIDEKVDSPINVFSGIYLKYPGRKKKYDYFLECDFIDNTRHQDIYNYLIENINSEYFSYQEAINMLEEVYTNGITNPSSNSMLEQCKQLVYWITLQEEINYPESIGKSGVRLPLSRYFEALYVTFVNEIVSLEEIKTRSNNYGRSVPRLYNIPSKPGYYW